MPLARILKTYFAFHHLSKFHIPFFFRRQRQLINEPIVLIEFVYIIEDPFIQLHLSRQFLPFGFEMSLPLSEDSFKDQKLLLGLFNLFWQVELDVHFVRLLFGFFVSGETFVLVHLLMIIVVDANIMRLLERHRMV